MSVITLTTDFGIKDYMVASVKGAILRNLPTANIVDISHQISPFDLGEASYIIKNAYLDFPEGSVHIIGVDALPNASKKLLAAKINGHYFLCADNGILSLILTEIKPEELMEITIGKYEDLSNFPTRDIFVPAACHIVRGGKLSIIGLPTDEFRELSSLKPYKKNDQTLVGFIIYIDNFGNVVINIQEQFFRTIQRGRNFEVKIRNHSFKKIFNRYSDIVTDWEKETQKQGDAMLLFNSSGFLELAMYKSNPLTFGGAANLMGLNLQDDIHISFFDEP